MMQLIENQRKFFNSNQTKNIDFRIQQLKKLEHILKSNEKLLDEAIYADFKKSSFDNFTNELALLYTDIHEAVKR